MPASLKNTNSRIVEPCFIGENVELSGSVIGPHVSIADGSIIKNSVIINSIVQKNTLIENAVIGNSMIGNSVVIRNKMQDLSIGDYSVLTS
jgi:glucose-1-phosphate thymidylyltransferase